MDMYSSQQQPYNRPNTNTFAILSLICGILALLTTCTAIGSFILGGLSILFAVLSHRRGRKLEMSALTGVITSTIGIAFSAVLFAVTFMALPQMLQSEEYRAQLNATSEAMYGYTMDEMLEQYGMDWDDLIP